MSEISKAMRRVITGDNKDGKSVVILDSGPSSIFGDPELGGLFEIWEDSASGPLHPREHKDLGMSPPRLGPHSGNFQVRWFVVQPLPEGVPPASLNEMTRERFAEIGAESHIIDQTRHPAMHETSTVDIICLLEGKAKLLLEDDETELSPGQVVIQQGTNHAWEAVDGPATFLAVLIDRQVIAD